MKRSTTTTMPASPADQSARQLDQSMRQLISGIHQLTIVSRAALQQFFSLADMAKRWGCSTDQVVKHLRDHCGYVGQPGVKPSISLDDVLRVDEALKASYEARKRVQAVGRGGHPFGIVVDVLPTGEVVVQTGGARAS